MSKNEIIHLDETEQQGMVNECVKILSDPSTHIKKDKAVSVTDANGNNKFSLNISPAAAIIYIDYDKFYIGLPSLVAKLIGALKACELKQTRTENKVSFNRVMKLLRGGNEKH